MDRRALLGMIGILPLEFLCKKKESRSICDNGKFVTIGPNGNYRTIKEWLEAISCG